MGTTVVRCRSFVTNRLGFRVSFMVSFSPQFAVAPNPLNPAYPSPPIDAAIPQRTPAYAPHLILSPIDRDPSTRADIVRHHRSVSE